MKNRAISTLLAIILGGAAMAANAALQTDVHSVAVRDGSEMTKFDDSLASSSVAGSFVYSFQNPDYTYYDVTFNGAASASGRTWYGGFEGHAASSNDGSYLGYAASAQSWVNNRWEDSFHFTGSGSATFHFVLDGTVATAGHGASPYGNQMQLQMGVQFLTLSPWAGDTFQNYAPSPGTIFLTGSSFHKEYDLTVNFVDGMNAPFYSYGTGTTWLSALNYAFRLDSVTFSPETSAGANVLNSTADLFYAAAVPEADTSAMLVTGLALLGIAVRRRKAGT